MGGRRANVAAESGAYREDGLDSVVDERARCGGGQAAIEIERDDLHPLAEATAVVQLGRGMERTCGRIEDERVPCHALAHAGPGADDIERRGLQPR